MKSEKGIMLPLCVCVVHVSHFYERVCLSVSERGEGRGGAIWRRRIGEM